MAGITRTYILSLALVLMLTGKYVFLFFNDTLIFSLESLYKRLNSQNNIESRKFECLKVVFSKEPSWLCQGVQIIFSTPFFDI